MNDIGLNKEEWYHLRDDRTRRIDGVTGFEDFSLGVTVNPEIKTSYQSQVMTLLTLNMLSRWCRKLDVSIPPNVVSLIPWHKGENFKSILVNMLGAIDPYGVYELDTPDLSSCKQILSIGQTEHSELVEKDCVWIDCSGWIAGIGKSPPVIYPNLKNTDKNPIGAAFASCLGVAEIFREATGISPSEDNSNWYSLFDFTKIQKQDQMNDHTYDSRFNFGKIHQVGCGAVASSLDFLIALTEWEIELYLIDYDQVEPSNCNRSLSFFAQDAFEKKPKVDACASVFESSEISCSTFKGSYADFIASNKYQDFPPDLTLCLANERNVWATIQHNYPPVVFHATTTTNWGVNFGRHIPKEEWCILCRFSREIDHKFKPPCGESQINVETNKTKPVYGVLPFLSPTAAVLVLAEMAKMAREDYPINNNFIEFSMRNLNTSFMTIQHGPQAGCICNGQDWDIYKTVRKNSKFWKLTRYEGD